MNPDGTFDTPRMPVAEHRRQLANGFCQSCFVWTRAGTRRQHGRSLQQEKRS